MRKDVISLFAVAATLSLAAPATSAAADGPSAKQALQLTPIQSDVEFDRPDPTAVEKCTIDSKTTDGPPGWYVRDEGGQLLRRFLDTNGDNKVDTWCYYQHGIEVYRDVDADFNGKADQYRYLGTAGTRWGLDKDEDGRVDAWKSISPEEVTEQLVMAVRDSDIVRFRQLLLSATELRQLGVGKKTAEDIETKLQEAADKFATVAAQQKMITRETVWVDFGGLRPGVVPAGTNGSTKDVIVYDGAVAMVETAGKHDQLQVGTLVRVGDAWRLIEFPGDPEGLFFQASIARRPDVQQQPTDTVDPKVKGLVDKLDQLDKAMAGATTPAQFAALNEQRADLLDELAAEAKDVKERAAWIRQTADAISAAVQSDQYPKGVERLEKLHKRMIDQKAPTELIAYVEYRSMTAAYGRSLKDPKADFPKIQEKWLADLQQFVDDYPKTNDAAEAMLQLAVAKEFAGEEDKAEQWYRQIVTDSPSSGAAKKAAGAVRRLNCVGKAIQLQGATTQGKTVNLAAYRGKIVVVHYWATWCEPCKQDIQTLETLHRAYGSKGLAMIGVSLDGTPQDLTGYLSKNPLPWSQIYEEGGLDSRLANEMGILSLPTTLLIDQHGKVLSRNIHVAQLEGELKKRIR